MEVARAEEEEEKEEAGNSIQQRKNWYYEMNTIKCNDDNSTAKASLN